MKKVIAITVLFLVVIGGLATARPALEYWQRVAAPAFRTADVSRGVITRVVRATGTVRPVSAVQVGAFVSGPIVELHVDFNDMVKKNDLLARIDPRIYEAEVALERAALATANAEVKRVSALLQQAQNEEARGLAVRADNKAFMSDTELDRLKFNRMSVEAQLELAKAGVDQATARLKNAEANLGYTEIRSPADGIIIDRKVEPGQTLASTFTTPLLFVVAPNLADEMHVLANVDEADIGLVRDAEKGNRPVYFTVDAYPKKKFKGAVKQLRSSSSIIESVVTFPVVVSTTNSSGELLPGMTANLVFETDVKNDVLRVPNVAIRFFPPAKYARERDRGLLSAQRGFSSIEVAANDDDTTQEDQSRRHVWLSDGRLLRAVEVTVGVSNDRYTEVVSGELAEGDQVVIGIGL